MTTAAPTFSQIRARVKAIREKVPDARVIGLRAAGVWTGERRRQDGNETWLIEQCDSPLAMRIALREPLGPAAIKVLITRMDEQQIDDDIRIRLAKRRLFDIHAWQIVKSLFQARLIDPRLMRHEWLPNYLLESGAVENYPPAPSGFLDAETVWPLVLERAIGLAAVRPDLLTILRWSIEAANVARFRGLPGTMQEAAIDWLSEMAGPAASAVLGCVLALERPDALPVGLAAGVVYHTASGGQLERAAGRMEERFFGGRRAHATEIERWNAAAQEVARLQLSDARVKQRLLQRTDEILGELLAESFAWLSEVSPLGFNQRLARFGSLLLDALQAPAASGFDALAGARQAIREHDRAPGESRCLDRMDMALRLLRWLRRVREGRTTPPPSLAEAARAHVAEGGFVDWARLALRSPEPVRELSQAYNRLFDEARQIRERQAREFAQLLRDWTAAGSAGEDPLPVERVLERIVAPLAAQAGVLVLVVDGMSMAVCRELLADITRQDWVLLAEAERGTLRPALAAIPSVTEASRTSLLCGELRTGAAADEQAGFAAHAALAAQCRSSHPAVLFHKPALREGDVVDLAGDVRREIASAQRRVVAAVINAVDDHLLKGEQIDTRWSRDEIRVLPALLHEARLARRLVVLLSDHGHVLDCQAVGRPAEGGERWRIDAGQAETDELAVAGSRVVMPDAGRLIAPWSERVRYGIKKNGYHGGLSPQEMVVPVAVLSAGDVPSGWDEARVETPEWWDEPAGPAAPRAPAAEEIPPPRPKPPGMLFDLSGDEEVTPAPPAEPAKSTPAWIKKFIESEVFAQQKRMGGRALPADQQLERLLAVLDGRGCRMTAAALAKSLEYPLHRLRGLLAVAGRLLNVDGYGVLTRDEPSDTIELNRELLIRQFDLA